MPPTPHMSRSLRRQIRTGGWSCAVDGNFPAVIQQCADRHRIDDGGTWITADIINAFLQLHAIGIAHSVEVYHGQSLIGGIYGLSVGNAFFGESMFGAVSGASKFAFTALAAYIAHRAIDFVDCQLPTPHLLSLGARIISRDAFEPLLARALTAPTAVGSWHHCAPPAQSMADDELMRAVRRSSDKNQHLARTVPYRV